MASLKFGKTLEWRFGYPYRVMVISLWNPSQEAMVFVGEIIHLLRVVSTFTKSVEGNEARSLHAIR